MEDPQIFYIEENTDINGVWVNYKTKTDDNKAGVLCTLDTITKKCGVRANDQDSTALTFVQSSSSDPFVIEVTGRRHTADSTAVSNNFDGWIKFVANSGFSDLDYESGNTQFNLGVYAKDSDLARSVGEAKIIVHVLDANDRPYLDLQTCPTGAADQMCIRLNENEEHKVNLRSDTQDQDVQSAWECCDTTAPYAFTTDDTRNNNGCVMSKFAIWIKAGFDGTAATQAGFKITANTIDYETDTDGCDMIITIKDRNTPTGLVSHPQYIHIDVLDINDAPTDLRLRTTPASGNEGSCSIDENTPIGTLLPGDCQLIADDEDRPAQDISYHRNSPANFDGTTGTDFTSWTSYFNIENDGGIIIDSPPNFEEAHVVKFDVTASDPLGASTAVKTITITINDVNEPPQFTSAMLSQNVPSSTVVGGTSNLFCSIGITVQEMQTTALTTKLTARDPDKDTATATAAWKHLAFSITPDYAALPNVIGVAFSGDLFTIETSSTGDSDGVYSGTLTPVSNNIDYETMYTNEGMRMGIKVVDGDGDASSIDCDISINIIDINEKPYISELPDNGVVDNGVSKPQGKSIDNPLIFSTTNVKVGDLVGPTLPIVDPDTGNPNTPGSKGLNDQAHCVAVVDGDTDWDNFKIDDGCQIYVKDTTANSKTLSSAEAVYVLKVKAVDQGRSFITSAIVPLESEVYTFHIKGKADLSSPVLNIYNSGNEYKFEIDEDIAGTIAQGTTDPTNDLYKACTDANVPGRGNPDVCSTTNACTTRTEEDDCNGATSPAPTPTDCEWVEGPPSSCKCRDQGLRYKIVSQSTIPRKSNALEDPIAVNKNSAVLTVLEKTDYESLFAIDGEIKCTIGQPQPYNAGGIYDFWPEFMNGVQGVCRAYNNDIKKATNALGRKGYLDSAHLCAERGARLATLDELKIAYNDVSGNFRTAQILDLWNYPTSVDSTQLGGGGSASPTKQNGAGKEKYPADTVALRAWTYGGKVAAITDVAEPSLVEGDVDPRTAYPVLCYVGKGFENEDFPSEKITKSNKPDLGYSIRLRCLDTAKYTVNEDLLEYYPQSMISDRFVFVKVNDVQEAPYFSSEKLEIVIPENIGRIGSDTCAEEDNTWTMTIKSGPNDNNVGVTEAAGVPVTQGSSTGTLVTALQNEWTIYFESQIITANAGVAVTQGSGGDLVTGTLKTALTGDTVSVIIQCVSDVIFTKGKDIVIVGSPTELLTNAVTDTNELSFAAAHGFAPGTAVVYSDNSETTITELTDGTTYYVLAGTTASKMKLEVSLSSGAITIAAGQGATNNKVTGPTPADITVLESNIATAAHSGATSLVTILPDTSGDSFSRTSVDTRTLVVGSHTFVSTEVREAVRGCVIETGANALDYDHGDAKSLVFTIPDTQPFKNIDQTEANIAFTANGKSTSIFTDMAKIPAGHFDHELQDTWIFTLTVTDAGGMSGTQEVTVYISDVNEPPILRNPDSPADPSSALNVGSQPIGGWSSVYKTYTVSEAAASGFVLGDLMAWDPDVNTLLSFDVEGSENSCGTDCKIFTTGNTAINPDSATYDTTGKITDAKLILADTSKLDFETKQTYSVTLKVTDTEGLTDTADLKITVLNVNDLEITSITPSVPTLTTGGGESVTIVGKNFGVKYNGADVPSLSSQDPTLSVTYGRPDQPSSKWFTATCTVNNVGTANTQLDCTTGPGYGSNHVWNITVTTDTNSNEIEGWATSKLSHSTSYTTPVISSIAMPSSTSYACSPNTIPLQSCIPTNGEHAIVLTGTDMGPADLALEGYYGPIGVGYCAKNCRVTTANTEVTCTTIEGIGQNHNWRLEIINHAWSGAASAATVTTSYAVPTVTNIVVGSLSGGTIMSTWGDESIVIEGTNLGPLFDPQSNCVPANPGKVRLKRFFFPTSPTS